MGTEPRATPNPAQRRKKMATFVTLVNFTDQGIRAVKQSPDRFEAFKGLMEKMGGSVKAVWWTVGSHDMVVVCEGSEEMATAALLTVGSLGNVRTQTLRAFDETEIRRIIGLMP